jgi:hypothetical protein
MTAMLWSDCIGLSPTSLPCWIASRHDSGLPLKSLGANSDFATICEKRNASSNEARANPLAGAVFVEISVVISRPFRCVM